MATQPTLPATPDPPASIERDDASWIEIAPGTLCKRVSLSSSEWAYIIGQLESNERGLFTGGDYIQVSQNLDITDLSYLDFPLEIIGRENSWSASILIDGTQFINKEIKENKIMTWSDFRVPVAHLTGTVNVAVRLTFEA